MKFRAFYCRMLFMAVEHNHAVVEDSRYGVEAARAAGMRAFGFAGGLTPAAWLEGPGTVVFSDMRELPALLTREAP